MCNWITAVCISAFSWGTADTIFDVIINNEDESNNLPTKNNEDIKKTANHLTHSQTMLLCAFTTYIIIIGYMIIVEYQGIGYIILRSKGITDLLILIISGTFSYYHYHFIIKAFENSSSTVILPFLQFSSIFAFLFSIIQNFLSDRPYLSNKIHLIAYFLILLGGLAPATDGQITKIFKPYFWKQPFVKYAIISDMCHAVYTNMVSYVGSEENGAEFDLYLNMEFFILTRVMFVVIFIIILSKNKQVQFEAVQLFRKPKQLVIGTIGGEILTLLGYFCSVYAYQCYYQAGVVSASESSLNLITNLFLAFILKRHFNIGKIASLQNLGLKILSCITISMGLVMAGV